MNEDIKKELQHLKTTGQLKDFHATLSRSPAVIEIKSRKLADFSNWDLLNLNFNKTLKRTVQEEIEKYGVGAGSSRLSSGTFYSHLSAEKRIASFLNLGSALLFSSKNQAVLSLMNALVNEADTVFFDEHLQSPVQDACNLLNATAIPFNSSNLSSFENEIIKSKNARRRFIFVESISPISGKKNDLPALTAIAKRNDARLVVDESYALAYSGLRGAGQTEEQGCLKDVFCIYASLAYGFSVYNSFIAADQVLIDYIAQRSRTFTNEISIPQAFAAGIETSINIVELSHVEREKLKLNVKLLRDGLSDAGFLDARQSDSPIVCIMVGKYKRAMDFAAILEQRGYFVDAIQMQTSLTDIGMLRMLVQVSHTPAVIDGFLAVLSEIYNKVTEE